MGLGVTVAVNGTADDQLSGAAEVEVHERMGRTTTFRLTYALDIAGGDLPLLTDSRLDPGSILSVLVPWNDATICLVKGPVHAQRVRVVHGGAGSQLDVEGGDTTLRMDREDRARVWDSEHDSDAVSTIVGQYGLTADVTDTQGTRSEEKHALVQRSSDLAFVRRLADRNGSLFWVTADGEGNETAHFKPAPFDGEPAKTLNINLDPPAFATLDLSWDVERATSTLAAQVDLSDLGDIDGAVEKSSLALLGAQGLATITGDTRDMHLAAPVDDAGDLQARGQGALTDSTAFVSATGETTLAALGHIARAHTVVKLDGLGTRHSGKYFVASVTHTITDQEHRMRLQLIRNAWGAA